MAISRDLVVPAYAELRCRSNFSFLQGASHAEELVERAKVLGYAALAVTDECSMAGVVRAHVAAKEHDLKLILGSQFRVEEGDDSHFHLVVLACNLEGYGNLCQFITRLRRSAEKGTYRLEIKDVDPGALTHCLVLAVPDREATDAQLIALATWTLARFAGRCWMAGEVLRLLDDEMWVLRLRWVSEQ
jgi:error-prone DNA polymerase